MADEWKRRVGIPINFSPDGSEDDCMLQTEKEQSATWQRDCIEISSDGYNHCEDDILNEYSEYGVTPPRTRISRRMKERKQREKEEFSTDRRASKIIQAKTKRRNTLDSIYFSELLERSENRTVDGQEEPFVRQDSRRSKKSLKLQRGSERDMKLDEEAASDDRADSMPAIKVETCNRFLSLTSKLVSCRDVKRLACAAAPVILGCPQKRVDFYNTFSLLIRMGSSEKDCERQPRRQPSREDVLWQNELQDLIWLELQAWHAERTPTEQDAFLCHARQQVTSVLNDIMCYRFACEVQHCAGCLSLHCQNCIYQQNMALGEVEDLLNRLAAAEALYPSSKALAVQYPLYRSPQFIGRVKAMCLWYNITKHHRLRLLIIGKLLMLLQAKDSIWPSLTDSSSVTDTCASDDSRLTSQSVSSEEKPCSCSTKLAAELDVESSSPSDSNNSSSSSTHEAHKCSSVDSLERPQQLLLDYYNSSSVSKLEQSVLQDQGSVTYSYPYRKYIEQVLKTRGLGKALHFLEKLYRNVLRKAMITLEKPEAWLWGDESRDSEEASWWGPDGDDELRRFGAWSPEAQALELPSYRAAFLFLARVPLELVHEFLRMRLEQKPQQPSALSIQQLLREFKEGLRIAIFHRQRYLQLVEAACWGDEKEGSTEDLDCSMKSVLEVYLDYLQQWLQMVQQESFHKSFLEDEWSFVKGTCPHIPGADALAGRSFCEMAVAMLHATADQLTSRLDHITTSLDSCDSPEDDTSPRQVMFSVCREIQALFNESREKALKAIAFAKAVKKDMEATGVLPDSLDELKNNALLVCEQLTASIRSVELMSICDEDGLDEADRTALASRFREILHLGYKLAFEYHKELCRLVTGDARVKLARGLIVLALQWMRFVKQRCERGRGMRPRWANQGLDFLMTICEPHITNYLTDEEFEELKSSIDECISHVIGTAYVPSQSAHSPRVIEGTGPRSRASSPTPQSRLRSLSYRSSRSLSAQTNQAATAPRWQRVRAAVQHLDTILDEHLRANNLIGSEAQLGNLHTIQVRPRCVTFGWQRGIKIGQGRFGKVYTAVNNETGELMAMKEIQLQPNDHRTIRLVTEELHIFEGIQHNHLVRYYGVEIHREEMLLFMEFCAEGTLEGLVAASQAGLPETLVRRYTQQLLQAVATLHQHGIVHRDIKSANIFLTDEGNCLKLGDFGSAVKIKAHTTLPGELKGFVGTQAYMAPEVFMKTNTDGHGRAADIWSLGCVVLEMASGKRPWAEFDSNYQIMFKVGMGEIPTAPTILSTEGSNFLELCLQHDPHSRWPAHDLLHHSFVRVDVDYSGLASALPSIFRECIT